MDSIPADRWIADLARWVRIHEANLGGHVRRKADHRNNNTGLTSALSSIIGLGTFPSKSDHHHHQPAPMNLNTNPHHLYFLLIRFEALSLPVGPLDVTIPVAARPTSYFSFISAASQRNTDDTSSISSFRSKISLVSSNLSLGSSWWPQWSTAKSDSITHLKYLYSAFTKIPSVRLGPIPATNLIQDFQDCPGHCSVPLQVFKNLHILELDEIDPRTILGWDRLSMQLRSLTCKKCGIEDVSDLIIQLVLNDDRQRKLSNSENQSEIETEADDGHANQGETEPAAGPAWSPTQDPDDTAPRPPLPHLSWHFLRYLNLSSNNLTFVPSAPLLALPGLTNLDLSSNLLNVVPPALCHLPNLTSLNINDNLIDSVLGIYDTLKSIRVLNLAKNRLESLCGLERLFTLERIDLRTNCIYEAGEVGRLATLPLIKEVWIKDNPLMDELADYRVDCFVEFAIEAKSVLLDGEAPGMFESQRIHHRLPTLFDSASASTFTSRRSTLEEEEARNANQTSKNSTMVKSVKHRGSAAQHPSPSVDQVVGVAKSVSHNPLETTHSSPSNKPARMDVATDSASPKSPNDNDASASKRRNRRVVDLNHTPVKNSNNAKTSHHANPTDSDAHLTQPPEGIATDPVLLFPLQRPVSELDSAAAVPMLTQAALPTTPSRADTLSADQLFSHTQILVTIPFELQTHSDPPTETASAPSKRFRTRGKNVAEADGNSLVNGDQEQAEDATLVASSAAALSQREMVTARPYEPNATDLMSGGNYVNQNNGKGIQGQQQQQQDESAADQSRSEAFRRKIEALKGEVGDDWLRLLARGGEATNASLTASIKDPSCDETVEPRETRKRRPQLEASAVTSKATQSNEAGSSVEALVKKSSRCAEAAARQVSNQAGCKMDKKKSKAKTSKRQVDVG